MVIFKNRERLEKVHEKMRWKAVERDDPEELIWISIKGQSMMPFLREGDRVGVVKDVMPDIGDLMVFIRNDDVYIHRCLDIRLTDNLTREYLEKGDRYYDGNWIAESAIIGIVRYLDREGEIRELRTHLMRPLGLGHRQLLHLARYVGVHQRNPGRWRFVMPGLMRRYLNFKARRIFKKMPRRNRSVLIGDNAETIQMEEKA